MVPPLRLLSRLAPGAIAMCLALCAPAQELHPHAARQSVTDLEITGLAAGSQWVSEAELLRLPQITVTPNPDSDSGHLIRKVTGIPLEALARALHAPNSFDLIDALCDDHYRSHYPAAYSAQHHPILGMRIDGLTSAEWAAKNHQYDAGPYFITYDHFVPAFQVLAHHDQPQLPDNVIRLNFSTQQATFGPISPPATASEQARQGFTIAKQNCLRCHAQGVVGGTKSAFPWQTLAAIAQSSPDTFSGYILDPKSINPQATMPAHPTYDEATRAALTAYFQSMNAPEPAK